MSNRLILHKVLCVLLVGMLLFTGILPVSASEQVEPRYSHIQTFTFSFDINQNTGLATCTGMVDIRTFDTVKIVLHLQQYKNGSWQTIKSWQATGSMCAGLNQKYFVADGYAYRLYCYGYVYNSNNVLVEQDSGTIYRTY